VGDERYRLERGDHHRYPLQIVHVETGAVVARYYATSEESARDHCARLNHGEYSARLEAPDDSQLTFTEAVARARKLGDPTPGNGWRRLLWRMADLLESEQ
jgi:hypothetical protein